MIYRHLRYFPTIFRSSVISRSVWANLNTCFLGPICVFLLLLADTIEKETGQAWFPTMRIASQPIAGLRNTEIPKIGHHAFDSH
jgi:hypothetical protein